MDRMWGKCPQDRLPPLASGSSLSRSLPLLLLLSAPRLTSPQTSPSPLPSHSRDPAWHPDCHRRFVSAGHSSWHTWVERIQDVWEESLGRECFLWEEECCPRGRGSKQSQEGNSEGQADRSRATLQEQRPPQPCRGGWRQSPQRLRPDMLTAGCEHSPCPTGFSS